MKIELHRNRYAGHAKSDAAAPEVYDLDDAGYCLLRSVEVPGRPRTAGPDRATACPSRRSVSSKADPRVSV